MLSEVVRKHKARRRVVRRCDVQPHPHRRFRLAGTGSQIGNDPPNSSAECPHRRAATPDFIRIQTPSPASTLSSMPASTGLRITSKRCGTAGGDPSASGLRGSRRSCHRVSTDSTLFRQPRRSNSLYSRILCRRETHGGGDCKWTKRSQVAHRELEIG